MAGCVGGGEGGIRTRDALPRTAFPVRRHSPLGDLSARLARITVGRGEGDRGTVSVAAGPATWEAIASGEVSRRRFERPEVVLRPRRRRAPERAGRRARERRSGGANVGLGQPQGASVAERVGFEPTVLSHTAFRERHHQPLGHLSAGEDTKGRLTGRSPALGTSPHLRLERPMFRPEAEAPG